MVNTPVVSQNAPINTRLSRTLFLGVSLLAAAFLLTINLLMPMAGEDYSLQLWWYHQAPPTLQEKVLTTVHNIYGTAVHWSPRMGEMLSKITGAFPAVVFDILNTGALVWLVILLFAIAFGRFPSLRRSADGRALLILFALFILVFPLLGQLWFWKAGTTNHTWGNIALLSFLLPFRIKSMGERIARSFWLMLIYILGAFLAGLSVENSAALVLAGTYGYSVYLAVRRKFDFRLILPILAFTLGVGVLLFAPGTTYRRSYYGNLPYYGELTGLALYAERLNRILNDLLLTSTPLLILFLASAVFYLVVVLRPWQPPAAGAPKPESGMASLPQVALFFLAGLASVLVLVTIAYNSDQQRGFEFFWLVLTCLSTYFVARCLEKLSSTALRSGLMACLGIVVAVQMFFMLREYTLFQRAYQQRVLLIQAALAKGETSLVLPEITLANTRTLDTREYMGDLGKRIALYYGLDEVIIER